MLGSSLGTVENGEFNETNMTSFGEADPSVPESEAFFTGKPMLHGMGYAFLFRNYKPETGKWISSDPLGYPDGWNNLAYCNNWVTDCFDWLGAATATLRGRSVSGSMGIATHLSMHFRVTTAELNQLSQSQRSHFTDIGNGFHTSVISSFQTDDSSMPGTSYNDLRYNDPSDTISSTNAIDIVSPNPGQSTLNFIQRYLTFSETYETYETGVDYDWFPNDPDEGNCNALQGTFIGYAGGTIDANNIPNNAYGFNHRIGTQYFE